MDLPTTSNQKEDITETQIKPKTLGRYTTRTLKRLAWKLKQDQISQNISLAEPVARAARYTGIHILNIEKLLAFGNIENYSPVEIDRRVIHTKLTGMYIVQKHIPSITEFFDSLQDILPIYVDIDLFTKILIEMGYVFYKFPGSKALRVMEKKSVTFERYRYLKNIQQCRREKVPIVYIGFTSLNKELELLNLERTLQTDPKNIAHHVLFTATAEEIGNVKIIPTKYEYELLPDIIKKWLLVICNTQTIPPASMCVLEDSKIFRKTLVDIPTWKSVKADIVDWLQEHNIPCDINMPKVDLLQLVETCTDTNKNTYILDNLLKPYKYSVLRLPHCINGLSIVPFLIKLFNDKKEFSFETVSKVDLEYFSEMVHLEEKVQLNEDIEIDELLDDLVRKIKMFNEDEQKNEDDVILTYSDSE